MNHATLGGLHGAGEVHSRRVSDSRAEYRGTFAFHTEDTSIMARLLDTGEVVEYVGQIGREHGALRVLVTDVSFDRGIAYFMGKGEPYMVSRDQASGQ